MSNARPPFHTYLLADNLRRRTGSRCILGVLLLTLALPHATASAAPGFRGRAGLEPTRKLPRLPGLLRRLAPARILATGRLLLGTMWLSRAVADGKLSQDQRGRLVRRASSALQGLPLTVKSLQTALDALDLSLVPQKHRSSAWYAHLEKTLDLLRPLVQSQVAPMTESKLRRYLGEAAKGLPLGSDSLLAAGSIGQVHSGVFVQRQPDGRALRRPVVIKVRKPGLERDIAITSDAIRDGFGVLGAIIARPPMTPRLSAAARQQLSAVVKAAKQLFPDYVQNFRQEGDFGAELRAMRTFRRIYQGSPYVLVPEPIAERSSDKVLMMARVEGDSLSSYLGRFERAQRWRRVEPHHRGPLPSGAAGRREAVRRARLFARQTFGLDPKVDPRVEKTPTGYRLTLAFDSRVQPAAQIEVSARGRLRALGTVPDLSVRGVIALQRRMLGAFIASARHGVVHGDPHQGNLRVLADGKTLALLDFGNVVKLPPGTKAGLSVAVRGLAFNRPRMIARGLLATIPSFGALDAPRQRAAIEATSVVVRELLAAGRRHTFGQLGQKWPQLLARLGASGLRVQAQDVGLLRASFTLLGNVAAMQRTLGLQLPRRRLWAAQLGDAALSGLARLGQRLRPARRAVPSEGKDQRAQRLFEEAQRLREASSAR